MDKERRAHKRYVVTGLRARVCESTMFGLSSKPTSQEYPCMDISEGGLQIAVNKQLKPQDKLILDVSIPNNRNNPIRIKTRVVWVKLSGNSGLVGLQFSDLDDKQTTAIKELIGKFGSDKDQTTAYLRSKMLKGDSLYGRFQK
ncbi:MAG: PilZ domain-containing protein [Planctomycetes bacterium]|nr:PilZ domain-containing protein [Planctomycetota bacterium]